MRAISSGSFVLVIAKVLARLLMSFPLYRQKILLSQMLEIMIPIRIHFVLSRSMLLTCCIRFFLFVFFFPHQGNKSANSEEDVLLKTLGMLVQQHR